MKQFTIVLVNWKTRRLTALCLELIRTHVDLNVAEVLVVDNNSDDDSTRYLRQLDWITLIERPVEGAEAGHLAHGRALDLALDHVRTRYLFCFHTDTLLHNARLLTRMLDMMGPGVAGVGTTEQLRRTWYSSSWRWLRRGVRHGYQRVSRRLGWRRHPPRPWRETHLKSFCALWDVDLLREQGLRFSCGERNPGYEMQDRLEAAGYSIVRLPPRTVFAALDHVQSGTLVEIGDHVSNRRRTRQYQALLERFDDFSA